MMDVFANHEIGRSENKERANTMKSNKSLAFLAGLGCIFIPVLTGVGLRQQTDQGLRTVQDPLIDNTPLFEPRPATEPGAAAASDLYLLDNGHSSVIFAVNHFGLSYVYGRFNTVSGVFKMADGEPTRAGFSFTIKTESIDTNNAERDEHLRGPDFFDCQQFADITFITTGFSKEGEEYHITGDLKMLGKVRSVTMPIQLVGIGTDPFGNDRAGFFTRFTLKRSDFGMDKMIGSIGDNISITFSFEGIRQK